MNLREYLFYERKSLTQFAKDLRVSRNHLSRISLGAYKPSYRLAKDIAAATDYKVTIADLLGPEDKK